MRRRHHRLRLTRRGDAAWMASELPTQILPLPISDPTTVHHRDDFSIFVVGNYRSIQCFRGTSLRRLPSVNTSSSRNEFPRIVQDDILAFSTREGTVEVIDVGGGHPVGIIESVRSFGSDDFALRTPVQGGCGRFRRRRSRRARESSDVDIRHGGLTGMGVRSLARGDVYRSKGNRLQLAVKRGVLGGPRACPPVLLVACSEYAEMWSTWVSGTLKTVKSKKHFFRTCEISRAPVRRMKCLLWDSFTSSFLMMMCESRRSRLWSFNEKGRLRRSVPIPLHSCSGLDTDETGVAYCLGRNEIALCDLREGKEVSLYTDLHLSNRGLFDYSSRQSKDRRIVCPKEPGRHTVVVANSSSVLLFDRRKMKKFVSEMHIVTGSVQSVVHCVENLYVGISDREIVVLDSGQSSVLARAQTPQNSLGVAVHGDVHLERLRTLEEEKLIYCSSIELEDCVMADIRLVGSTIKVFVAFLLELSFSEERRYQI